MTGAGRPAPGAAPQRTAPHRIETRAECGGSSAAQARPRPQAPNPGRQPAQAGSQPRRTARSAWGGRTDGRLFGAPAGAAAVRSDRRAGGGCWARSRPWPYVREVSYDLSAGRAAGGRRPGRARTQREREQRPAEHGRRAGQVESRAQRKTEHRAQSTEQSTDRAERRAQGKTSRAQRALARHAKPQHTRLLVFFVPGPPPRPPGPSRPRDTVPPQSFHSFRPAQRRRLPGARARRRRRRRHLLSRHHHHHRPRPLPPRPSPLLCTPLVSAQDRFHPSPPLPSP